MTVDSLASRGRWLAATQRIAASSVAPVASGYERSLRPWLALGQRTPSTKNHFETSSQGINRHKLGTNP